MMSVATSTDTVDYMEYLLSIAHEVILLTIAVHSNFSNKNLLLEFSCCNKLSFKIKNSWNNVESSKQMLLITWTFITTKSHNYFVPFISENENKLVNWLGKLPIAGLQSVILNRAEAGFFFQTFEVRITRVLMIWSSWQSWWALLSWMSADNSI